MASHDMSHCGGNHCKKKETCHRFLQYEKLDLFPYGVSILEPATCIKNKHQLYWEVDNANKSS